MHNDAAPKTKPTRGWLAKRPRWHGVHRSPQQLETDIRAFSDAHNADPKPFRWTKSAADVLAAIQRFCARTQEIIRASEARR